MVRLIAWKQDGYTITRRGIWTRNESIVDAIECPPCQVAEMRAHMETLRDVYGAPVEIRAYEVA